MKRQLLRIASDLPKGDPTRRSLLAALKREAGPRPPREIQRWMDKLDASKFTEPSDDIAESGIIDWDFDPARRGEGYDLSVIFNVPPNDPPSKHSPRTSRSPWDEEPPLQASPT